jgi:hypothetical protein
VKLRGLILGLLLALQAMLASLSTTACTPRAWRENAETEAREALAKICPCREFRVVCGPFTDDGFEAHCTVTSGSATLQITCDDDIASFNDGCSGTEKIPDFCRARQGAPQ